MAKDSFSFKRFVIRQDLCGMKVGTDGVLLGAWAACGSSSLGDKWNATDNDSDTSGHCPRVLDIGTGTGLIALMMAQRFPNALVDGVDIDASACRQASMNVSDSPFADRITIIDTRLQDFSPTYKYDCIVSNPPYFDNSLRCLDHSRMTARHTDTLSFAELLKGVSQLLSSDGLFSVVLPAGCMNRFLTETIFLRLYETRRCMVKTTKDKPPKRVLLTFGRHRIADREGSVETLTNADGSRSEWYGNLTKDFYL